MESRTRHKDYKLLRVERWFSGQIIQRLQSLCSDNLPRFQLTDKIVTGHILGGTSDKRTGKELGWVLGRSQTESGRLIYLQMEQRTNQGVGLENPGYTYWNIGYGRYRSI